MDRRCLWLAMTLANGASVCSAQTLPELGQTQVIKGISSSLAGPILPNVASASLGNVTGVLGYCVKNKLIGDIGATSVLKALSGRSAVASSKDFVLGRTGQLQTGVGTMSLGSVKENVRSKICDVVLQQATKLL